MARQNSNISNHEWIRKALSLLHQGLYPYFKGEMTKVYATKWLVQTADGLGKDSFAIDKHLKEDLSSFLKVFRNEWKDVFQKNLGRTGRNLLEECIDIRNGWAHKSTISNDDTERALDTIIRFLNAVSAPEAEQVKQYKQELLQQLKPFERPQQQHVELPVSPEVPSSKKQASKSEQSWRIQDPLDFERCVALRFKQAGYEVLMPPANMRGYDIELRKGTKCTAVQVKNYKRTCGISEVEKFQHFLTLPAASKFTGGCLISGSGYSRPALTHVKTEQPENFWLGTFCENKFSWDYPEIIDESSTPANQDLAEVKTRYFGVFTCKGGVGKTTVAAHLAGAFALMGYNFILLDLDPDRNLRKLFLQDLEDEEGEASLFVPPKNSKNDLGATITVLNHDQWEEEDYPDVKIVICDCSPVLNENPQSLVEKFDYCIVPTTLNPLGVSKNGDVIIRTFKHIRERNVNAEMFALINNYESKQAKRNEVLLSHLRFSLSKYISADPKCQFIDPEDAKIRSSDALLYWGYHLVEGTKPQLAFQETSGRSYPRTDFLQLAEYLENHIDLDELRA
jgi:chromosome partitioning protein